MYLSLDTLSIMKKVAPITRGGQISLPAEVRHRWGVERVMLIDQGEQMIIKPLAANPARALIGRFALPHGVTSDALREQARSEEAEAEGRKYGETATDPAPTA